MERLLALERAILNGPRDQPPWSSELLAEFRPLAEEADGGGDVLTSALRVVIAHNDAREETREGAGAAALHRYAALVDTLSARVAGQPVARRRGGADEEGLRALAALARVHLATLLGDGGRPAAEIDAHFRRALSGCPELVASYARMRYAEWLGFTGEVAPAERQISDAGQTAAARNTTFVVRQTRAQVAVTCGDRLVRAGRFDEADAIFKAALEFVSPDVGPEAAVPGWQGRLQAALAQSLMKQGKDQAAADALLAGVQSYLVEGEHGSAGVLLEMRGDTLLRLRQDDAALAAYVGSLAEEDRRQEPDRERRAVLLARIGLCRLQTGDLPRADAAFAQSRALVPAGDWRNPDMRVLGGLSDLLDERADLTATIKTYYAHLRAIEPSVVRRRDLADAMRLLLYRASPSVPDEPPPLWTRADGSDAWPIVLPIRVLVPLWLIDGLSDGDVDTLMRTVRADILKRTGFTIPGVRFADDVENADTLTISVMGVERLRMAFSPLPAETRWARVGEHLVATLTAHVADLIGQQEVQALQEAGERPDGRKLISDARVAEMVAFESLEHMAALTELVRALMAEGVSVNRFWEIHAAFLRGQALGDDPHAVAAAVRIARFGELPGNGPDAAGPFLLLPAELTDAVRVAPCVNGVIAMPAESTVALRQQVAHALRRHGPATVLVTADRELRARVSAFLTACSVPVPVLALAELNPAHRAAVRELAS